MREPQHCATPEVVYSHVPGADYAMMYARHRQGIMCWAPWHPGTFTATATVVVFIIMVVSIIVVSIMVVVIPIVVFIIVVMVVVVSFPLAMLNPCSFPQLPQTSKQPAPCPAISSPFS